VPGRAIIVSAAAIDMGYGSVFLRSLPPPLASTVDPVFSLAQ